FSLGYGARWLTPLFQKPSAWRVLDTLIAIIMALLAISLLMRLV
ncbi:MAG: amino acid transporter, partial [Pseudomonadota bacterium]